MFHAAHWPKILAFYESEIVPALPNLRRSVIYGDANDHNVLVSAPWPLPRQAQSVIDFGDMHLGITVSEVAIAAAYAMLGKEDVLSAAASVVSGYHEAFPLQEHEIAALYTLIGTRLAVSVTNSAYRQTLKPGDAYVTISEAPAWEALERWRKFIRVSRTTPFVMHAASHQCRKAKPSAATSSSPVQQPHLFCPTICEPRQSVVFDLSAGSTFLGADPRASETDTLISKILQTLRKQDASIGVGRYNEARLLYTSPLFGSQANPLAERRTIHLGMDFFASIRDGNPCTLRRHGSCACK